MFYDKLVGIKYGTADDQFPVRKPSPKDTRSNGNPGAASTPAATTPTTSDLAQNRPPTSSAVTPTASDSSASGTTTVNDATPTSDLPATGGEGGTDAPRPTESATVDPAGSDTPMDVEPAVTVASKEEAVAAADVAGVAVVEPITPVPASSTAGSSVAGTGTSVSTAAPVKVTPLVASSGASEEVKAVVAPAAPAAAVASEEVKKVAVKSEESEVEGKGAAAEGGPLRVSMRLSNEMPEFVVVTSKYDEAVGFQWRSDMHIQMAFMEEPGDDIILVALGVKNTASDTLFFFCILREN